MKKKYLIAITSIFFVMNTYAQYRMLGIPKGDCNKKELTLVDNDNNPLTIVLTDANEKARLCSWVDWTSKRTRIVNQVIVLIGLKSTNKDYALLSFSGDCNKRIFRLYNKATKKIFEQEVLNNCSIIDFNRNPAEIATQVCEKFDCN